MSRRVVLYIAQSLDGYIARLNGEVDWLAGDGSDPEADFGFLTFYERIDTVVLGRKTYDQVVNELSPNEWPYEGKKCFVLTRQNLLSNEQVTFINEHFVSFIEALKQQEGQDIWIVGGSGVIDPLVKANVIDDYIISLMPVILGDGISLFEKKNPEILLTLKKAKTYNGGILMHYVKR